MNLLPTAEYPVKGTEVRAAIAYEFDFTNDFHRGGIAVELVPEILRTGSYDSWGVGKHLQLGVEARIMAGTGGPSGDLGLRALAQGGALGFRLGPVLAAGVSYVPRPNGSEPGFRLSGGVELGFAFPSGGPKLALSVEGGMLATPNNPVAPLFGLSLGGRF